MKKIGEGARKNEGEREGGKEKELQTVQATLGEKDRGTLIVIHIHTDYVQDYSRVAYMSLHNWWPQCEMVQSV